MILSAQPSLSKAVTKEGSSPKSDVDSADGDYLDSESDQKSAERGGDSDSGDDEDADESPATTKRPRETSHHHHVHVHPKDSKASQKAKADCDCSRSAGVAKGSRAGDIANLDSPVLDAANVTKAPDSSNSTTAAPSSPKPSASSSTIPPLVEATTSAAPNTTTTTTSSPVSDAASSTQTPSTGGQPRGSRISAKDEARDDDDDSVEDYTDEGEYRTTSAPNYWRSAAANEATPPSFVTVNSPPMNLTVVSTSEAPQPKNAPITIKPLTSTPKL